MSKEHIISVDTSRCVRCGLCKKDCVHGSFTVTESGAEVTSQDCIKCGHCAAICPHGAISLSGYDDAPEELQDTIPDPNALLAMIKGRRSIRHFTQRDIPPEVIANIIEAGRYTPTGRNRQGVSYVVLRENKDEYEKLAVSRLRRLKPIVGIFFKQFKHFTIDDHYFFKGAPVAIVIKSNDTLDGALAASAMELVARSYGLGVLYNGMFGIAAGVSRKLKRKLSSASRANIVTTLVLGYPSVKYQRTAQRERPVIQYD